MFFRKVFKLLQIQALLKHTYIRWTSLPQFWEIFCQISGTPFLWKKSVSGSCLFFLCIAKHVTSKMLQVAEKELKYQNIYYHKIEIISSYKFQTLFVIQKKGKCEYEIMHKICYIFWKNVSTLNIMTYIISQIWSSKKLYNWIMRCFLNVWI